MPPSPAMESAALGQLPWAVTHSEFARAAAEAAADAACCVFVIDGSIPQQARAGYAALVIAYARAEEPVLILEDGAAALLVRAGGTAAGEVVARRVLTEMRRLALERTIRAGVVPMAPVCDDALSAARGAAERAEPGSIATLR